MGWGGQAPNDDDTMLLGFLGLMFGATATSQIPASMSAMLSSKTSMSKDGCLDDENISWALEAPAAADDFVEEEGMEDLDAKL